MSVNYQCKQKKKVTNILVAVFRGILHSVIERKNKENSSYVYTDMVENL